MVHFLAELTMDLHLLISFPQGDLGALQWGLVRSQSHKILCRHISKHCWLIVFYFPTVWAPPPSGMMFPPRFPHGGPPVPPAPHPHYATPMRPPAPDGVPPISLGPPQQSLPSPPHSQSPEEHTRSPEDNIWLSDMFLVTKWYPSGRWMAGSLHFFLPYFFASIY